MKVNIVSHTPNPEQLIAAAANLCYSDMPIDKLQEKLTPEKAATLNEKLLNMGHESPFEHINFTFSIEGISRVVSHQMVRHRVGCSYNQRSQRYINESEGNYVTPNLIQKDEIIENMYQEFIENAFENYDTVTQALTFNLILEWSIDNWPEFYNLQENMEVEKAVQFFIDRQKKIYQQFKRRAQEEARYLLPNACATSLIVTMNARALFNFFKLRCCRRAQDEINQLAWEMLRQVKNISPVIFRNAGAPCQFGPCPEGEYSCGKPYRSKEDGNK